MASSSVTSKLAVIGILVVACLIPTALVYPLIADREMRQDSVLSEIGSAWGLEQQVTGPILLVPYDQLAFDGLGKVSGRTRGVMTLLPDTVEYASTLEPEVRSRGIYDVVVYASDVSAKGAFSFPALEASESVNRTFFWNEARLAMGITDTRGVRSAVDFTWGDARVTFRPGSSVQNTFANGMHAPVAFSPDRKTYPFEISLSLQGSEGVSFLPIGASTKATIDSTWPAPGYNGSFLPVTHKETDAGFSASWDISEYGRPFAQRSFGSEGEDLLSGRYGSAFGVQLVQSVDFYAKVTRMVKYAILFIVLTFVTFFLFDVLARVRVHPFQYLVVGAALGLFYLLLLALSEQLGFLSAYLLSAACIVGMITFYSRSILHGGRRAVMVGALLCTLYAYLYFLVQMEDYALLYGAFLLTAILGGIMVITRNVDWYRLSDDSQRQ